MHTTIEELEGWLSVDAEDEHIEFKEAKNQFDSTKLVNYCVALANERGGKLILGVSDKRPRKVVGTSAYPNLNKPRELLHQKLRMRIEVEELLHPDGRVIIFHVPSRPTGTALSNDGSYFMRAGESLRPMPFDVLKKIADEAKQDYSAEICHKASLSNLHPEAIATLRELWRKKSGNENIPKTSDKQLLTDAELLRDGAVTYAALILLGTRVAFGKHLPQAEVIFEYRSSNASIQYQQRKEFREGFFLYYDQLWNTINLRNEVQHIQNGLFMMDIAAFSERVVRESILNAITHRDYRRKESVLVRQFPHKLEVISPADFPPE